MLVTELLDVLDEQLRRQPLVEARTGPQALQTYLLDVPGDHGPLVSAAAPRLERDQQDMNRHIQLLHGHAHARKNQDRGERGGLLLEYLVGQRYLLLQTHPLGAEVGLRGH